MRKPYNKFRVAPKAQRTYKGIVFHSKLEMQRYQQLEVMLENGQISNLERQIRFHLKVNGEQITDYIADFRYVTNRPIIWQKTKKIKYEWAVGDVTIEDAKGRKTDSYNIKWRMMKAIHKIIVYETYAPIKPKTTSRKKVKNATSVE